ncbi:globin domain-containing protein [Cyanobium sp. LEGE 06113]|uniref:globin domain-containing protein n=1 Tax=Cyanobium sp. LEGE 06113 TaxID=1297573 RepID=UPI0018826208|nr:globin domain-containing protein [Cyanobium sp. LEGE 06113]MBE9153644.1 bacitracin resistance protein BacA [Cyanobium sp. LEGE 06113]
MTIGISQKTIDIVKATAPVVKEHGEKITSRMYEIAFSERPDYKLGFESTWMIDAHGNGQAKKLASSVYAYATHIDRLDELAKAVDAIAHRHVACRILPEQYPLIGEKLLQAMKEVLGDAATDEVMAAWTEAYGALAAILIDAEASLYKQNDIDLVEKLGTSQI